MTTLEILILALALSADAFSVGAAVGLRYSGARQVFRLSFHFGLFQSLMVWSGALLGTFFLAYIQRVDHWVAALLLTIIGGRMIYLSRHDDPSRLTRADLTRGFSLVGLSIAVSVDAFAAGIGLPALGAPLPLSGLVIGGVAAGATAAAMLLSGRISALVGRRCEGMAGFVLIGLGVYILLEHLNLLH